MVDDSQPIPQLHRQIENLRRRLAETFQGQGASRELTRVLAALGHELRDPLAPLRNAVELMKRAETSDPLLCQAREVINRQVALMTRLVDGLLASGLTQDSAPGAEPTPASPRPRRILIVEDLLDAAITMEMLLEMLGHTVEIAADGAEGLAKANRFDPEIILCDIGLPGQMDGYAVARAIRATPRLQGTYLIALTGRATPEDRSLARQAGFNLHLIKPIDPATLEPLIAGIP
jgi:CheY-like chemotaxis protein